MDKKESFERVLKILLLVFNAVLLLAFLSAISDGGKINWPVFILIILLLDGIPLLVYLCTYIIMWSKLNSKQKIARSVISIASFLLVLCTVIPIVGNTTGGGSGSNDTKRCGSCHRTFERYDTWKNLDDDYSSIQLRGMCERCYENYKWTHGK